MQLFFKEMYCTRILRGKQTTKVSFKTKEKKNEELAEALPLQCVSKASTQLP